MHGLIYSAILRKTLHKPLVFAVIFNLKDLHRHFQSAECASLSGFPAQSCGYRIRPYRHRRESTVHPHSPHLNHRRYTHLREIGACDSRSSFLPLSLRWRTMSVATSWQGHRHPAKRSVPVHSSARTDGCRNPDRRAVYSASPALPRFAGILPVRYQLPFISL